MLRRNGIFGQVVVAKNRRLYCAIPPHEASVPKNLKLCLESSNPFPTNGRRAEENLTQRGQRTALRSIQGNGCTCQQFRARERCCFHALTELRQTTGQASGHDFIQRQKPNYGRKRAPPDAKAELWRDCSPAPPLRRRQRRSCPQIALWSFAKGMRARRPRRWRSAERSGL